MAALEGDDRVDELAEMMAGTTASDVSRAQARELVAIAQKAPLPPVATKPRAAARKKSGQKSAQKSAPTSAQKTERGAATKKRGAASRGGSPRVKKSATKPRAKRGAAAAVATATI